VCVRREEYTRVFGKEHKTLRREGHYNMGHMATCSACKIKKKVVGENVK